jgi:asparagine synthase (glutamine-hydrolysing)
MCGIYGIWNTDGRPVDLGALRRATTTLRHRGPDDEGYVLDVGTGHGAVSYGGEDAEAALGLTPISVAADRQATLALGFRRLAILDLSPLGHQPMRSEDGRYWIVFNGEIYNYRELRDTLIGAGHRFRSESDTEVLLAAYRQWGPACLEKLNGMWAFAIWDSMDERLFLARDRFGVKPLYWTSKPDRFAFASEIKALVGNDGVPFTPDDDAVYQFLVFGRQPDPRAGATFFRGVQSLPPGHSMRVDRRGVVIDRYYEIPVQPAEDAGVEQAVAEFRSLLEDAVRIHLRSDVPVGTCLSGGLDSSSIVYLIDRIKRRDLTEPHEETRTFSAVYAGTGPYNERRHIDTMLHATSASGRMVEPRVERLRHELDRLVWHQDEPFATTSIFAQWCVMADARAAGVTVMLDGQGADEVLAGYRPMLGALVSSHLMSGRLAEAAAVSRQIQRTTGMTSAALALSILPWHVPSSVRAFARRTARRQASSLVSQALAGSAAQGDVADGERRNFGSYLKERVEDGLPHLLRYEDRNSMAFSIEARVPFLDHRLVEYAFGKGSAYRVRDGWSKWILRAAMHGSLPDSITWRRDKVGFETPERDWLREWLAADLSGWRDELTACPFLDARGVGRITSAFARGAPVGETLWRARCLAAWYRMWSSTPDVESTGRAWSGAPAHSTVAAAGGV